MYYKLKSYNQINSDVHEDIYAGMFITIEFIVVRGKNDNRQNITGDPLNKSWYHCNH